MGLPLTVALLVLWTHGLRALGQRLGPRRAGLLVGLPSTTALVLLTAARDGGPTAALAVADAALIGLIAAAAAPLAFAAALGWRVGAASALAAGAAGYLGVAGLARAIAPADPAGRVLLALAGVGLACGLAGRAWPGRPHPPRNRGGSRTPTPAPRPMGPTRHARRLDRGARTGPAPRPSAGGAPHRTTRRLPATAAAAAVIRHRVPTAAPVPADRPRRASRVLVLRTAVPVGCLLAVTTLRHAAGAEWAGVLTPFPGLSLTLLVLTHLESGPRAAALMARALPAANLAMIAFLAAVRGLAPALGLTPALGLGGLGALLVLAAVDRTTRPEPARPSAAPGPHFRPPPSGRSRRRIPAPYTPALEAIRARA